MPTALKVITNEVSHELKCGQLIFDGDIAIAKVNKGTFTLTDAETLIDVFDKRGWSGNGKLIFEVSNRSVPNPEGVRYLMNHIAQYVELMALTFDSIFIRTIIKVQLTFTPPPIRFALFKNLKTAKEWVLKPSENVSDLTMNDSGSSQELISILCSYGTLDFKARMNVPEDKNDDWSAIAIAVNMLGAKLEESAIAKSKLENEKNKLKRLFDALDKIAIITLTDRRGVILEANDHFCKISGYDREELIGNTHQLLKSGYHPQSFFSDMWKIISSKQPWRSDICNKAKDGSLYWVDSTIIPLLDSSGRIINYFSIRHDITQRKNTEASLLQATKMASVGEMAGSIAHEINNPIAVIDGSAGRILKLLKNQPLDLASIETFAKSISETSGRVASIVNGMRTLSRNADTDAYDYVKIDEIIEDVLALARERLERHGIKLISCIHPEIMVWGNKTQLGQVLLNLIGNADDALLNQPNSWIRVEAHETSSTIELSVTDSGSGVPEEVRKKMFMPFFTTKEPGKGTGLGLSLSKKILEQHGGKLIIDSTCENTRFILQLPIKKI